MRVIFMGCPDFALPTLERLIKSTHQVVAVVTQPDRPKGRGRKIQCTPVKERALEEGIPVFAPERVNDPDFIEKLKALAPDAIVVVAFGQILSSAILNLPPLGCINVHASLLPKYRGAAPIHWALIKGEKETGVTTMFMDKGMDTGDMILKKAIPINDGDTTGTIHDQLADVGGRLLIETLALLQNDQVPRTVQTSHLATYAPPLTREHECICWEKSAKEVHNLVRGLHPWPGAYTSFAHKRLKIWETKPGGLINMGQAGEAIQKTALRDDFSQGSLPPKEPGAILAILPEEGILVQCGQGVLIISSIQPQGKKIMGADAWARGARLEKGSKLG